MTEIPVKIKLSGKNNADGDISEIKFYSFGTFKGEPDDYTMTYEEKSEELKGCITTLHVVGKRCVTMSRAGGYASEMIMEKAQRHTCLYNTPYGTLEMGTFAHHVASDVENGEGKLEFFYTLDCGGSLLASNELTVEVKKK